MNAPILARLGAAVVLAFSNATAVAMMLVEGTADANGDLITESFLYDSEFWPILTRSAIEVSDSAPGSFSYFTRADLVVPELVIAGSLTDSGLGVPGSLTPLLNVSSTLSEVLHLTPANADPYTVRVDMLVDGTLDVDGSDAEVFAQIDLQLLSPSAPTQTQLRHYTTSGTVNDTLTVVQLPVSGNADLQINSVLSFFLFQIDAGASVNANFLNSAVFKVTITDALGNPAAVEVVSESGMFGIHPVPLPPALALLLSALAVLGLGRRGSAGRSAL